MYYAPRETHPLQQLPPVAVPEVDIPKFDPARSGLEAHGRGGVVYGRRLRGEVEHGFHVHYALPELQGRRMRQTYEADI